MSHIAIVGAAPSRALAPYADPAWQIWACSPGLGPLLPRFDLWFELHSKAKLLNPAAWGEEKAVTKSWLADYRAWLGQQPAVCMQEAMGPNVTAYPRQQVLDAFGPYFLTSQVAEMMAMAILRQPKVIGLWGVEMEAASEYAVQRPGCHYFIQRAREWNIEVVAPQGSSILEPPPMYGWRQNEAMYWSLVAHRKDLEQQALAHEGETVNAMKKAALMRGAIQEVEHVLNTWTK